MKAVILAAGMASRLRPLTEHTPKCLLKVCGLTLLQRTVDAFVKSGINEFVVVTGYLRQMIEDFFMETYPGLRVTFVHNAEYRDTNNIYSLWLARPYVDGEAFLLSDSDILFDWRIIPALLDNPRTCLALCRHECGPEEIKVMADRDGTVREISKTCPPELCQGESVGFEKINADYSIALFRELEVMITGPERLVNLFYERCFERLIPQGFCFVCVDTTKYFSMELDTLDDFQCAAELLPPDINAGRV